MIKKVVALLLISCVLSCQDTKNKNISEPKPKKVQNKTPSKLQKETTGAVPGKSSVRFDTIKKVKQTALIPFLKNYGKENPENRVVVSTEFGDMKIKLFKDTPLHRANFIRMAKLGYFDGTYFYRVIDDFVVQAGNSDQRRTARMRHAIGKYLIPKEFNKHHLHNYGAVSMAKFSKQNVSKASSPFEFFIVVNKRGAHHLDFEHTVIGRVTKGMDVAEKIAQVKTSSDDWPLSDIPVKVKVLD